MYDNHLESRTFSISHNIAILQKGYTSGSLDEKGGMNYDVSKMI